MTKQQDNVKKRIEESWDPEGPAAAKHMNKDELETVLAQTAYEKCVGYEPPRVAGITGDRTPFKCLKHISPDEINMLVEGLHYNEDMLSEACKTLTYESPLMHDPNVRTRLNVFVSYMNDMREYIDVSKKIVDDIFERQYMEMHQRELMLHLLNEDEVRLFDKKLQFVVVDPAADVRRESKRMLALTERYPQFKIEPVNITPGLENVEPLPSDDESIVESPVPV